MYIGLEDAQRRVHKMDHKMDPEKYVSPEKMPRVQADQEAVPEIVWRPGPGETISSWKEAGQTC